VSVTADEEDRFTTGSPATINVNKGNRAAFGDVTVIGGPGDEIVITAHKTAWAADTASAQADLDKLKVVVNQTGNVIDVYVDGPEQMVTLGRSQPDTVDFTIAVPVETSVYLVSDFGDLSASGIEGAVHFDTDFGGATLTNVTGGGIYVRSGFGEIKLDQVNGDGIDVQSNSGEISLEAVQATGDISLDTDFGAIDFIGGSARSLTAKTNSGEIRLETLQIKERVEASSDYGGVTLNKVTALSYDLHSNSGSLTLVGASGAVKMRTDFGDVSLSDAEDVTVDLKTNSGSVDFAGSLGDGPHIIKTDFGPIRLQLPKTSALTVDLETDFGRVKSDLPISLTGDQDNGHWVGDINGGGVKLEAKTNSGEITIETLDP
jgi:DUF4097 and DUF4098 domain-containing protein YvlB